MEAEAVVVGAGLAGLVAACELADAGVRVVVLEQEGEESLGGQAWWSFGGLFLVDSPEQRRLGVRDSLELAWRDWLGAAGFDRPEDERPRRWAQAYVEFAATEKRRWLRSLGVRFFPIVGWAERGGGAATGHGNSVPRFHIVWGTGPGVLAPFIARLRAAQARRQIQVLWRHRVTALRVERGAVQGVEGDVLAPSTGVRGAPSSREPVRAFAIRAPVVVLATGGIGGNVELVRRYWPTDRWGAPPDALLCGVPAHVDGALWAIAEAAGAAVLHRDRMWHYPEGVAFYDPIWPAHGVRILPGPSALWLDALGRRLPPPLFPGFDAWATLAHLRRTGWDHSWFVATEAVVAREFALSGSDQNPDLASGRLLWVLRERGGGRMPGPVRRFLARGEDWIRASSLEELTARMNALVGADLIDPRDLRETIRARDAQIRVGLGKDAQVMAIYAARRYRGDRWIRVAPPHPFLDGDGGSLVAVRLRTLTRKTLGGLATDLDARVLRPDGTPIEGLYAAGEIAGFGGGGMHGYRSLEGTFLGGCLFSGRVAGRAAARALRGRPAATPTNGHGR